MIASLNKKVSSLIGNKFGAFYKPGAIPSGSLTQITLFTTVSTFLVDSWNSNNIQIAIKKR